MIDFDIEEINIGTIELQSFTSTPHRTIHIIQMNPNNSSEQRLLIGRESVCEMRITDVSVSR